MSDVIGFATVGTSSGTYIYTGGNTIYMPATLNVVPGAVYYPDVAARHGAVVGWYDKPIEQPKAALAALVARYQKERG